MKPVRSYGKFKKEHPGPVTRPSSMGDVTKLTRTDTTLRTDPPPQNIVIIDEDNTIYADYELNRAYSEILLSHPRAKEQLYIIKFSIVKSSEYYILKISSPASIGTFSLGKTYDLSDVLKILHREIQKCSVIYKNIFGCSLYCNYLKIHNPQQYSSMICCNSIENMISLCFGVNYCVPVFREMYRDSIIENVANFIVVLTVYYGVNHDNITKKSLENKFPEINIISVLRDPRFEMITNLRFNPWLLCFENLHDNGKCIMLFNKKQCDNKKINGLNYCRDHKCALCNDKCRHTTKETVGK